MIARTAGRIDQARFVLKQKLIQTLPNEEANSLHGGPKGFAQQFFNVTVNQEQGQIILKKTLSETDDSFPGTLELTVSYTQLVACRRQPCIWSIKETRQSKTLSRSPILN